MSNVNKQLLEALAQLDLAETEVINAKAWSAGEQAKKHCDFALTAIATARQAIAAAERATSSGAGWQDFNDGFKAGAEEMRDGLLQLCKDFSDRQNRPYMGDVLAQVDSLFDLIVLETPRSLERKAEQAQRPCQYCDGTGDVHSITGEWRGVCSCEAGKTQLAVPEGYALVPIEPTQAMLCAGQEEWLESAGGRPVF